MKEFLLSWGFIFIASLCNSYASFIVKLRFNHLGTMDLRSFKKIVLYVFEFLKSPLVLSAVVTFLLSPLFWVVALNKVDLSIAIPVQFSMHLLLVLIFSALFLHEKITYHKIAGVLCLALSLFFLYRS